MGSDFSADEYTKRTDEVLSLPALEIIPRGRGQVLGFKVRGLEETRLAEFNGCYTRIEKFLPKQLYKRQGSRKSNYLEKIDNDWFYFIKYNAGDSRNHPVMRSDGFSWSSLPAYGDPESSLIE